MQHIEFFDKAHFENNYYRVQPPASLSHFIDFYWQTKFEHLWEIYPDGFSDALFPNTGYSYLINMGTPYTMQVKDEKYKISKDSFLPRHNSIECFHQKGNVIFGIKFKISPVILEKKVNFSEYKSSMTPLSYLIDADIVHRVKTARTFNERVLILNEYFISIVHRYEGSLTAVNIVSEILDNYNLKNDFTISIESLASKYCISVRTLQRYFESTTSLSTKQTLQILRVRKAVAHLATGDPSFDYKQYGYYDYSHFYKHLRKFLRKPMLENLKGMIKQTVN